MSILSSTIPNLVNGVSQQPYAIRLASQAEIQTNAISSVVDGLQKRPPTKHLAKISNTPVSAGRVHIINRDVTERYVVVSTAGGIQITDLLGNQKTVNAPDGFGYLATDNPERDHLMVTVADFTFVLNKARTVEKSSLTVPSRPHEAIVWIRQGAYSTTYTATIDGFSATYVTPDSSNAANAPLIRTEYIAEQLKTQLETALSDDFEFIQFGSSIYVKSTTINFPASTYDSLGDTAIKLLYRSTQRFTDLPAKGFAGFTIRIAGTTENSFDDYWVKFDGTEGVWKECEKPGEQYAFENSTMPHVLIREADGTFTFRPYVWNPRVVGDVESVPWPSFTNRKIRSIFFYRNRLGFLSDENMILSEASEFFNFFKKSAIQTVDTDVIDVAVSHVKVSILHHAVPYNDTLIVFSDQTQFQMGKTELLTPRTVTLNATTEFDTDLQAVPVGAGNNVYFAQSRGRYAGIREYYVDEDNNTNDAADVTAHVPRYIKGRVVKLAASSNEDCLAVLADGERSVIYIYKYFWAKDEKLQSSWSRWELAPGTFVLNMEFIESDLVVVSARPDGTYVETITLAPGTVDAPSNLVVHLDRRTTHEVSLPTYSEETKKTTIVLPWTPHQDEHYEIIAWFGDEAQSYKPGQNVPYTRVGSTFTVDKRLRYYFIGTRYEMRYRFSTLVIREQSQGGSSPVAEGRVQVRQMTLLYHNSGYFRVEVTPKNRGPYTYRFTGRVLGSLLNKIGEIPIEEGVFRFPVQSKNDQVTVDIVNDTYLPCSFMSAEWEAFFVIRSKRM